MVVLETERLILRTLVESDLDALSAIQADPAVMAFFPTGIRSRDDTRRDIERCGAIQRDHGFSLWATVDRRDGRLIGRCGLLPQKIQGGDEIEIAYLLARDCWGLGLATEAAAAIRDLGFDQYGFHRLVSLIARENLASRRVAEKTGLRQEGVVQFLQQRCLLYGVSAEQRPPPGVPLEGGAGARRDGESAGT